MLQKSYLKYELRDTFGVIAAVDSDVAFFGKTLLTGGLERVLSWNIRSGELLSSFGSYDVSEAATVTRLLVSPDGVSFAAGYSNGAVRIWGPGEQGRMEVRSTFTGHTRPVTALAFSKDGGLLATGSQSTEVLVWDVLGQAGRARLKGHKAGVTGLVFGANHKLISSSKDTMVLVWDLTLQQCVQTLVGHRHEVWDVVLDASKRLLVTGSSDNKLRVWKLEGEEFVFYGGVDRSTETRVGCMAFSNSNRLVVQTAGKAVEVFSLNDEATRQKKMKRRLKREQKKLETKRAQLQQSVGVPGFDLDHELSALEERYKAGPRASDELVLSYSFAAGHRLHRMSVQPGRSAVAFVSNRNELMVYRIGGKEATLDVEIELPGHRSDVRALALNSNDAKLLSASQNSVKLWNTESGKCEGSIELEGSALCAVFLPLDTHAAVGTKEGRIELLDISGAQVVEAIACHEGAIWDLQITPDKKGLVTASADKTVKYWSFAVRKLPGGETALTLQLSRTLTVGDDALSVCFSGDGKLVAVGLLDATVAVFFNDTHKLFLALYGHKLPVLSVSISSDSRLLVSGSADKNVKIWGLDFGDCHRSMFADDSVTRVQFLPSTHYFVTTSKDGTIKYWDADRFERVAVLRGHHSEIWCLAVSSVGDFLVTGSHDRSIRVWAQTEELLFPESERQKELDQLFAPSAHELQQQVAAPSNAELEATAEGISGLEGESSAPAVQTLASLKHAERLSDAIELAFDEWAKYEDWRSALVVAEKQMQVEEREAKRRKGLPLLAPPDKNPLLLGQMPEEYLRLELVRIPLSELDTALALLTFSAAMQLLSFCSVWLEQGAAATNMETVCRICFFLVRSHIRELSQAKKYRNLLARLQTLCRDRLQNLRQTVAFNTAGAVYLQRQLKTDQTAAEFFQASKLLKEKMASKKQKEGSRKVIY